jgi:aspartate/methionine/tyrosine aminotransferase
MARQHAARFDEKRAIVLHGFVTVCTSTISQKAALTAWSDEARQATEQARKITKNGAIFLLICCGAN